MKKIRKKVKPILVIGLCSPHHIDHLVDNLTKKNLLPHNMKKIAEHFFSKKNASFNGMFDDMLNIVFSAEVVPGLNFQFSQRMNLDTDPIAYLVGYPMTKSQFHFLLNMSYLEMYELKILNNFGDTSYHDGIESLVEYVKLSMDNMKIAFHNLE